MDTKYALLVMSENGDQHPGGQGRLVHALKTAKDLKAAGIPVKIFFHGIGVQWLTAFETKPDRFTQNYGPLFDELKDVMGGACHFCAATRFKASDSAAKLGVPLVGNPGDHHNVASLVADGYQLLTF